MNLLELINNYKYIQIGVICFPINKILSFEVIGTDVAIKTEKAEITTSSRDISLL